MSAFDQWVAEGMKDPEFAEAYAEMDRELAAQRLSHAEHHNALTPAQDERLALLIEEMSEAIQSACKIMRHGYGGRHPDSDQTNREDLERELGHVRHAINRMCDAGDISNGCLDMYAFEKAASIARWLHHQ